MKAFEGALDSVYRTRAPAAAQEAVRAASAATSAESPGQSPSAPPRPSGEFDAFDLPCAIELHLFPCVCLPRFARCRSISTGGGSISPTACNWRSRGCPLGQSPA